MTDRIHLLGDPQIQNLSVRHAQEFTTQCNAADVCYLCFSVLIVVYLYLPDPGVKSSKYVLLVCCIKCMSYKSTSSCQLVAVRIGEH